ncbi:MAG TPA: lipopolysaccharide heptosyltransferase II [Casimicrobiaceae bacterium]|nr:lipopolysaccharide heptosyltransferase II [Casimicrobiaceae bacterium]
MRHALSPGRRSESRSLTQRPPTADDARSALRALVVAPSWVGDAILSEPLIAALARRGADVDVIAPAWCAPVYARVQGVRRIIDAPFAHGRFGWTTRRALGHALRDARYTHAYVLPNTWKSALVPWFARIPVRTGYVGEMRYGLLTDPRRIDRRRVPKLVARYAALASPRSESSPIDEAQLAPRLVPDAANRDAAMRAMQLTRERPVAILCPGAEFGPAKRWPAEHFAALARRLHDDGCAIWILGSPNDRAAAAQVIAALDGATRVVDLTGRTDLGSAIDLMSVAALVVTNDSGLMHAAAAVGVPLVALFGSSSPAYTPPLSEKAKIARIDIACSPCFKRECPLGHFRCMRDLSPDMVYNLARSSLVLQAPPS